MSRIVLAVTVITLIVLIIFLGVKVSKTKLVSRSSDNASGYLAQAKDFEAKGKILDAKAVYQKLINDFPGSRDIMGWQKKVEELNMKTLFSPIVSPQSTLYEIKPGDTLTSIAKKFITTTDLLTKSNNLTTDIIVPGRSIKVWTVPFTILVDKSQNILLLKAGDEIIKTYSVSTGKNNCTPAGTFKIVNKLTHPTWFKAGAVVPSGSPENILGSRWLGFDLAGYGIHGTTEPQNLGQQVTQGCVRMSNNEVEEIYTIVPIGTEVTIVD